MVNKQVDHIGVATDGTNAVDFVSVSWLPTLKRKVDGRVITIKHKENTAMLICLKT